MTVQQLIDELNKLPKDSECIVLTYVNIWNDNHPAILLQCSIPIDKVWHEGVKTGENITVIHAELMKGKGL